MSAKENDFVTIRFMNGRKDKLTELYAHDQAKTPGVKLSYTDSIESAIDLALFVNSLESEIDTITSIRQDPSKQKEQAIRMAVKFYATFLKNKADKEQQQKGAQE